MFSFKIFLCSDGLSVDNIVMHVSFGKQVYRAISKELATNVLALTGQSKYIKIMSEHCLQTLQKRSILFFFYYLIRLICLQQILVESIHCLLDSAQFRSLN